MPPFAMTMACRGVGDMDQVFEWLERGIEERDLMIISTSNASRLTPPAKETRATRLCYTR